MRGRRRPGPDTTPASFFERWLPAEIERLGGGAGGMAEMVVRVLLEGDGGGGWDLVVQGGQLQAGPTDAERQPGVMLEMSVQDWRAMVVGEPGPVDMAPPTASPTDLLFLDAASQDMLGAVSGTFRFEVRQYNGRTGQRWPTLGAGQRQDPPDAVIATDAATYGAILARELSPPEAYIDQRITLEGDMVAGMQVGLALMPKF